MITLDYLPNREEIKLYQDDEMFRINTDTFALGEFLNIYKQDTVLDIGTNTGALLLYASRFNPKKLIGLDINSKALELAKKNLELNNISNYELVNGDANNYLSEEVDVVASHLFGYLGTDVSLSNVVLTGGLAPLIKDILTINYYYEPNILIDGLIYLYYKNKK